MSADRARDALFAAIEAASSNSSADALLKLANAWALLQPDEPEPDAEEEQPPIHSVGGTQFLPYGAGSEYDGYEERGRVIGFTLPL